MFSFYAGRATVTSVALVWTLLLGGLSMSLPASAQSLGEPVGTVSQVQGVNINTADVATLAAGLKGVGLKRAAEIVAWREAHGPFSAPEQLLEIRGIGVKLLEQNKPLIQL